MRSKALLAALIGVGLAGLVAIAAGLVVKSHAPTAMAFRLVDAKSGQPFTERSLRGEASALFFGFTACPDVCPTALTTVGRWLKALGPDAAGIRFRFITVDPERDTPDQVAKYLSAFDPRIGGVSGSRAEIDRVIAAFNITARKVPAGSSYVYDHTALILLLDAEGHLRDTVDFDDPEEKALAKLRSVMRPDRPAVPTSTLPAR